WAREVDLLCLRARAYERLVLREPDRTGRTAPGLAYACYLAEAEGWEVLPDLAELKPVDRGVVSDLDPAKAPRPERYALAFTGWLDVPAEGLWVFSLESDDGSRLFIGDRLVVDNDGLHQKRLRRGKIALKAGKHAVRVLFLQGEGDRVLTAAWEGPGVPRECLPASAWSH
ncbi:MAG: PA14 domain-containing protein, partial [bacterium]